MTSPDLSEGYSRDISTLIAGAGTKAEVLDMLDKFGIEWHVSNEGDLIVKMWKVAAENFVPKEQVGIIMSRKAAPCPQETELEWLSRNLDTLKRDYSGQWIAICDGAVVSAAPDLPVLMQNLRGYDNPFITQIPGEPVVWKLTYGLQEI